MAEYQKELGLGMIKPIEFSNEFRNQFPGDQIFILHENFILNFSTSFMVIGILMTLHPPRSNGAK
jgi:hypothetical protein